jgi:aryl-phospho-beta-D-glucosidase BglC (GH1 family)
MAHGDLRIKILAFLFLVLWMSPHVYGQNLGRGINLGNMFEAPSETAWGNPFKEEYISQIAALGFSHIRVPIRWDVPERALLTDPYTVNPVFLARIKSVVDLAVSKNLYVIINMHHHEEMFTNPAAAKPRFLKQWAQIAAYFKGYNDRLLFEVLNEPHDALSPELWNVYFADALAEIRKTNPGRKVLLGTASYGGLGGVKDLNPPNDPNLILSIHYYNPFNFTHQGADWAGLKDKYIGTKWEDLSWERNQVVSEFDYAIQWAKQRKMPLHVGEFGSYELADMESRARWTTFLARWFESQGLSWAYWEYSAGFGIYNPQTGAYKQPLVDALLKNPMPAVRTLPTKNLYDMQGTGGWSLNLNSGALGNLVGAGNGFKVNMTSVTGTTWHIQLSRSGFPLTYKKRYAVKIKAQADKSLAITAYMGRSSNPYNAYSAYNGMVIETTEKEFSFLFTMNEPYDSNARLSLDIGSAIGILQINSIQVDEIIEEVPLSTQEAPKTSQVFPNPFNKQLNFRSPNAQHVRLIDFHGKIRQISLHSMEGIWDTSILAEGPYWVQFISEKTGQSESHLVQKQKDQ